MPLSPLQTSAGTARVGERGLGTAYRNVASTLAHARVHWHLMMLMSLGCRFSESGPHCTVSHFERQLVPSGRRGVTPLVPSVNRTSHGQPGVS
jgi:hypothetical protein